MTPQSSSEHELHCLEGKTGRKEGRILKLRTCKVCRRQTSPGLCPPKLETPNSGLWRISFPIHLLRGSEEQGPWLRHSVTLMPSTGPGPESELRHNKRMFFANLLRKTPGCQEEEVGGRKRWDRCSEQRGRSPRHPWVSGGWVCAGNVSAFELALGHACSLSSSPSKSQTGERCWEVECLGIQASPGQAGSRVREWEAEPLCTSSSPFRPWVQQGLPYTLSPDDFSAREVAAQQTPASRLGQCSGVTGVGPCPCASRLRSP